MSKRPTTRRPAERPTRKKKVSMIDRLLARIPLSHAALHRIATWAIVLGVLGGGYAVANIFGIPGAVGTALAEQIGKAGFRIEQIEKRGAKRMDVTTVYAVALDQKSRAMPLVDLDLVRDQQQQKGCVK